MIIIHDVLLVDAEQKKKGAVVIENGLITHVITKESGNVVSVMKELGDKAIFNAELIDGDGLHLMPGFIDMHAHFRYPGQCEKEDLSSGSKAAAKGGYTTVFLMPNTSPVVSDLETTIAINREVIDIGYIRAFQTMSITKDFDGKNTNHLDGLVNKNHYVPVITEDGKDVMSEDVMREAMIKAAKADVIVSCHCEDPSLVHQASELRKEGKFAEAEAVLAEAENSMTIRNLSLAQETNCKVHIAHVSTAVAIDAVRQAKKNCPSGKISCEITPHHLALNNEGSLISELVNPPLRSEKDRQALLHGVVDGTVDMIATDHAPHTMEDKKNGACGFSGIELAYSICNTNLVHTGLISEEKLSELMSKTPACKLDGRAGLIQKGYLADLVLVDPDYEFTVTSELVQKGFSKGKYTPFIGKNLKGIVVQTFLKGKCTYKKDQII